MDSMYEILMGLPIFQGVSHAKISELIEKIKFHFLKYTDGETIVDVDEPCTNLKFLISGSVRLETLNLNRRIKVLQTLNAPNIIGAEYLFGKRTSYPYSVKAHPVAGLMQVEKADFLKILKSDIVFLFNTLNYLSRNSQTPTEAVLSLTSGSVAERVAFWIGSLTYRGSSEIVIESKQKDMYTMLGIQRSSYINTLEELLDKGVLDFTSGAVYINDRDALLSEMTLG